jgi:GTP-binding protein
VLDETALKQQAARLKRAAKRTPLILSSATGRGVAEALRTLAAHIPVSRRDEAEKPAAPVSA